MPRNTARRHAAAATRTINVQVVARGKHVGRGRGLEDDLGRVGVRSGAVGLQPRAVQRRIRGKIARGRNADADGRRLAPDDVVQAIGPQDDAAVAVPGQRARHVLPGRAVERRGRAPQEHGGLADAVGKVIQVIHLVSRVPKHARVLRVGLERKRRREEVIARAVGSAVRRQQVVLGAAVRGRAAAGAHNQEGFVQTRRVRVQPRRVKGECARRIAGADGVFQRQRGHGALLRHGDRVRETRRRRQRTRSNQSAHPWRLNSGGRGVELLDWECVSAHARMH